MNRPKGSVDCDVVTPSSLDTQYMGWDETLPQPQSSPPSKPTVSTDPTTHSRIAKEAGPDAA